VALDRAYLEDQVREGEATIAVFQQELAEGSEPILRGFALDALPLVEERLREARSLIGPIGLAHFPFGSAKKIRGWRW
jgi:predicted outer membrane protein